MEDKIIEIEQDSKTLSKEELRDFVVKSLDRILEKYHYELTQAEKLLF